MGSREGALKGWANVTPEARKIRLEKLGKSRPDFSSAECSENARKAWEQPGFRENQVKKHLGQRPSTAIRAKLSAARRGVLRPQSGPAISAGQKAAWAKLSIEERRVRLAPAHASQKRFQPSSLERLMWAALDRFAIPYRTQARIGRYTADILADIGGLRLVIECDGAYWHSSEEAKEYDHQRDGFMRSKGFAVVRVPEAWIRSDPNDVARFLLPWP